MVLFGSKVEANQKLKLLSAGLSLLMSEICIDRLSPFKKCLLNHVLIDQDILTRWAVAVVKARVVVIIIVLTDYYCMTESYILCMDYYV